MIHKVEFLERINLIITLNFKLICSTNDTLICEVIIKHLKFDLWLCRHYS